MTRDELKALGELIVALNNRNDYTALMALYAPRVTSRESDPAGQGGTARGKKAIQGKWDWWVGANEVHSAKATGPFLHGGDRIGVIFEMDITDKASGNRMQMQELAIYTAKDGKITREEFYY